MGKYTLVAQNRKGHAISNCDLIVRKKQFPPVFWQRLYNYEASSGTRLVAEVEVGGWPVPEVTWFKVCSIELHARTTMQIISLMILTALSWVLDMKISLTEDLL